MHNSSDHDRLVDSTAAAFAATLHALLDGDGHAARVVLRGSAPRRRLISATQSIVREQRFVPGPSSATSCSTSPTSAG